MTDMTDKLQVYLQEYSALKEEQKSRIGFRDNLLYVNLAAVGAIFSFALNKPENKYALLVLPLVSLILGWTYLVNDQKISAIGQYIEEKLSQRVNYELNSPTSPIEEVFGWEEYHKTNDLFARRFRKIQQWLIDEITFVGSGILALIAFSEYLATENSLIHSIWWLELIVLIILGIEILAYAIPAIFSNRTKTSPPSQSELEADSASQSFNEGDHNR